MEKYSSIWFGRDAWTGRWISRALGQRSVNQLVSSSFDGFATWIAEHSDLALPADQAASIAAVGLGALLSSRLMPDVLGVAFNVDDEDLVTTWVQMMTAAIAHRTPA
jgi:hypothetical protein